MQRSALIEHAVFQPVKDSSLVNVNPVVVEGLESKCYESGVLANIVGAAEAVLALTGPNDFIIMPGRSMIQVATCIRQFTYEEENNLQRTLFTPAFSKGGLLFDTEREAFSKFQDEHATESTEAFESTSRHVLQWQTNKAIDELKATRTLIKDAFENNLFFYFDFRSQQIKPLKDFKLQPEDVVAYRKYLTTIWKLTPERLATCTGKIFIIDSVMSGQGLKGFLKILFDWCDEEHVNIQNKISIWNFGKEKTKSSLAHGNIILSEDAWVELSYNYVPDELTFFPPWAWSNEVLWKPNISDAMPHYQEMANYVTLAKQNNTQRHRIT